MDRVWTVFGWSPIIRRLVQGTTLTCGCLAGAYETWSNDIVLIIDAPSNACREDGHTQHCAVARHGHAGTGLPQQAS